MIITLEEYLRAESDLRWKYNPLGMLKWLEDLWYDVLSFLRLDTVTRFNLEELAFLT